MTGLPIPPNVEAIDWAEARKLVADVMAPVKALEVPLAEAAGTTLAVDLVANKPVPALEVAAVDGYAVRASELQPRLPVVQDVQWRDHWRRRHTPGTAALIPAGAPLPTGADAVIPLALTNLGLSQVDIDASALQITAGTNVKLPGSEIAAGLTVLPAGKRLGARELAIVAALGISRVSVRPAPRVVVITLGDELFDVRQAQPKWNSVPDISGHLITQLLQESGAQTLKVGPIADDAASLRHMIEDQEVRADVIVTLGGLGSGLGDRLSAALSAITNFQSYKIPALPPLRLGVGQLGATSRPIAIVSFSGSPIAAALGYMAVLRPTLRRLSGFSEISASRIKARVLTGWDSPAGLNHAVLLQISGDDTTGYKARPIGAPARPSLTNFALADGVYWVPAEVTNVARGSEITCEIW